MADAGFGFHSYADGSPRDDDAGDVRPSTAVPARWVEVPAYLEHAAPAERSGDWRRIAVAAGLSAAIAALATYSLTGSREPDPQPALGPQIVLAEPPQPAIPAPRDRLEVLPATPQSLSAPAAAPTPSAPLPADAVARTQRSTAGQTGLRPAPAPRNTFDNCRRAPTPAQRMVCSDMRVAAADQRMKQAYAAALAAGVPHRRLQRQQDAWLAARNDKTSRKAVLEAYRQRTQALWAMARAGA